MAEVDEASFRGGNAAIYGVPCLVAIATYLTALPAGFVLDDHHFLLDNPVVTGGIRLPLFEGVSTTGGTFYRPLPLLLMSVEHALWGPRPFGYHLVSVLAHVGVTAAVVTLARRLADARAALWAGVFFAVHAVHVEAVVAIANRSEVLATLFVVLAWHEVVRVQDRPETGLLRPLVVLNVLGLAGLLCKESAVVLPLGLVVIGLWRRPRLPLAPLMPLPGMAVAWALRRAAFDGHAVYEHQSAFVDDPGGRWLGVLDIIANYGRLLLAPVQQLASYAPPAYAPVEGVTLGVAVGAVIVVGVAGAVLVGLRRPQAGSVGLGLFVAAIAPYLHLVSLSVLMAERFVYLPSVGFCIAAGWATGVLSSRVERPRLVFVAAGLWATTLLGIAASRNLDWHSSLRLWQADVESSGGSALARANLGLALWAEEDYGGGIALLRQAVVFEPWQEPWVVALARMYTAVDMPSEAREIARLGLRYTPESELLRGFAGAETTAEGTQKYEH